MLDVVKKVIAFSIALCGCESSTLYVDDSCDPYSSYVESSFAAANEQLFEGDGVYVMGGGSLFGDTLYCSDVERSTQIGVYLDGDITLYMPRIDSYDVFQATLLHEIGHRYRGDRAHCDDCCVMSTWYQDGKSDYCPSDLTFLNYPQ